MKKTKISCLTLATIMLASSCTSSYQAAGGVTGAAIGSRVGGAVGFLSGHGHFRGSNAALGSLIGMGIGAVLGVGIASQIEENEKAEAARRQEGYGNNTYDTTSPTTTNDGTYDYPDYQIGGGSYNGSISTASVSISELTYMDADGDGYIAKGETVEVTGFVTNTSNTTIYDIVINLSVNDPKAYTVSPSLTTTLQPGQKIRYTGRVRCNKSRKGQSVGINLNASYASKDITSNQLFIRAK